MSALNSSTSDPSRGLAMLATALGPSITTILLAADTIEVIVNPDGRVWAERVGRGREFAGFRLEPTETERAIRLIATLTGAEVTRDRPIVSAELPPRGERFEGLLPPVVRAPCFAIRKPASQIISLDDYVASGVINDAQRLELKRAITDHANIIVAGGTGSGKTTLANALLAEIAALSERVVILEDTRELQCAAEDVVALRTQPGSVTLSDLVRSTLRLRPDRIVVGEVRGPEALDLLKAWNTGHPGGIATLHANSARAALARLEQLAMEASTSPPTALIAEAVDLVVFIERGGPAGRRISEIYAPKLDQLGAREPAAPGLKAHRSPSGA
ncbi:MAG: P-type conjugative transfer ATPase TrbB [Hyphomonadaceae bacterium]|nr:P-type conjugative transfer ATPase TrbB [Hyphomonadaceae bacterium]